MQPVRRSILAALATAPLVTVSGPAVAQANTRVLVGAGPGGGTDLVARMLTAEMSARLGQQFIVDNRPGAAGNIAAGSVAQAAPDGSTLLLSYTSHVINPSLYDKLPFDTIRDFTPIAGIAIQPAVLVAHPGLPANDVRELLALAKTRPGKMTIAIAGIGGSNHLAGEVLKLEGGVDIVSVPYKGTGPALTDVLAGQIDLVIAGVATVQQLLKSGKLKALAVTSLSRLDTLPGVPPVADVLPGFDFSSWYGLFGPAGLAPATADRLATGVHDALQAATIRERFANDGLIAMHGDRTTFAAFVRSEIDRWAGIVKSTGAKPG